MSIDYEQMARDQRRYYGEGDRHLRIYRRLYADKTHFIYELIQNADDADSKNLALILREKELIVWNDGRRFNENDVRGICSIGLSEKDLTQIGTFGIGFKSVYAYTDCPEIYSGEERFRIKRFVEPEVIDIISSNIGQLVAEGKTVFRLLFKGNLRPKDIEQVEEKFRDLGEQTLLFLRNLENIEWYDERSEKNGAYSCSRRQHKKIPNADRVKLSTEEWLVFRKEIKPSQKVIQDLTLMSEDAEEKERIRRSAQYKQPVEVAFKLQNGKISPLDRCVLFAYLPTETRTNLRFLIQARYQTTPARDNIRRDNVRDDSAWNSWLIQKTANFLPEILTHIKSAGLLTPDFLDVLPIESDGVPDIFKPICEAINQTLREREFIPIANGNYARPDQVFYPHSEELRKLITYQDLTELSGIRRVRWLHPDIRDTKEYSRRFGVIKSSDVREIGARQLITWLESKGACWLEKKSDEWVRNLYAYLSNHESEWERLKTLPLVRLENGGQVSPIDELVYLPPKDDEEFQDLKPFLKELPIIRTSLLENDKLEKVKTFLENIGVKSIGHTEVIPNCLLPKYQQESLPSAEENRSHLGYLKGALYKVPSNHKTLLLDQIRQTRLLLAWKGRDKNVLYYIKPTQSYLSQAYTGSADLEIYFMPCSDIWFVDEGYLKKADKAEEWYSFLKELGAVDLPRRQKKPNDPLSWDEKYQFWKNIGHTRDLGTDDWILDGLDEALKYIAENNSRAHKIARSLWKLMTRSIPIKQWERNSFFLGVYRWFYRIERSNSFDATFYRQLKEANWFLDEKGNFHTPDELFVPTNENRRLLGDSVAYLHHSFDLTDKQENEPARWFAPQLGIHLNADTESVLKYLRSLSRKKDIQVEILTRIYRFLDQQGAHRQGEFMQEQLIFTPKPQPRWWRSSETFWEDENSTFGDLRGYLKTYYPETLKPFFISIGVSERAAPLDYVRAIRNIASQEQVTDNLRERLHTLYRRLWHALQEDGSWQESEEWQQIKGDKCWMGCQGDKRGFYHRTQLVWNDHDYITKLFEGKLPFWPFNDLQEFAKCLQVEPCSQAQTTFCPIGEENMDENWSKKMQDLAADIVCFLESPKWKAQYHEKEFTQFLNSLSVRLVNRAQVTYVLKGVHVTDPDPRLSHLDAENAVLWLSREVNNQEYSDLIGDALQDYFGLKELREFVKDLLTRDRGKVLRSWQRRGLVIGLPDIPTDERESSASENENVSREIAPIEIDQRFDENRGKISNVAIEEKHEEEEGHRDSIIGWNRESERGGYTGSGGGGPSPEHERLKEKLASDPSLLEPGLKCIGTEYKFASGDRVDILLEDVNGIPVTVEVETSISNLEVGLWQAIKYKHLIAVKWGLACDQARSILAAPSISDNIKARCFKMGVESKEIS